MEFLQYALFIYIIQDYKMEGTLKVCFLLLTWHYITARFTHKATRKLLDDFTITNT